MTTQTGINTVNELNENNDKTAVIKQSSSNESDSNCEESMTTDKYEQKSTTSRHNSAHETEEKCNINDNTEVNSHSTTKQDSNEEQEQQKDIAVNNHDDEHRPRKSFNQKYKYSSMGYHRGLYYGNGHLYGPPPFYYYPIAPVTEKPPPLMVIPTQPPPTAASTTSTMTTTSTTTTATSTTTTTENQTSNSTSTTSQNLPPRMRQASANESESNSQQSSTQASATTSSQATANGRRHRSILPRGSCNYYSPHPPPPLMATPPGVLFPYPPTFHQPGHVAYNIRTPDELEVLALQQQAMNLATAPLLWPPTAYHPYPPYPLYDQSSYLCNNTTGLNSNNSLLNPEAAEWVPPNIDTDASSSENNILIDDEINFPPLHNNRIEENNTEQQNQVDSLPETDSTNNAEDKTTVPSSKPDTTISNSSSSQDDNKTVSSSKPTTISYSNVILQALDANKSNKTTKNNTNNQNQRRPQSSTNNVPVQLPPKDRTNKQQQQQQQQKPQVSNTKDNSVRRRPPPLNRNNFNGTRNSLPVEPTKQQSQQQHISDDWIEVKSKKTKKFDRSLTDIQYENSTTISQKSTSDQIITKTISPPSSLSSNSDNMMGTFTSEEDDDKDDLNIISNNKPVIDNETKDITTDKDYNQVIINDIHKKLENGERLLILLRGCPGSGKSTLAEALNNGYNGQILSADEYFKENISNEHRFDPTKLEPAHLYVHGLASDALKKQVTPIIIDNMNLTSWEMKPYATMGKEAGYEVILLEPQTPWRYKARELAKRNPHNVSFRRIKELLTHFEHDVMIENLVDQKKPNQSTSSQSQNGLEQNATDNESTDSMLSSKKSLNAIDDSNILNDVRLCIDDMILFLTSNFYQTSQSSTSLSLLFSDLSLTQASSSPTTPTTPHSLFHRSLSRLSSTTASQDHTFNNEHFYRLPPTVFPRCIEKFTPPSSANSSIIGKKRRKNKSKQQQQQSNEILLNNNTNNNNNNNQYYSTIIETNNYLQPSTYNVILPEDCSEFMIIEDQYDNDSCDHFTENFSQRRHPLRNHSSVNPKKQKSNTNKKDELLTIIHDELVQPSATTGRIPSKSTTNIASQCSSDDFNREPDETDRILIGHLSTQLKVSTPISPPPGFIERGIQVDLNENAAGSLSNLIDFYSNLLSSEVIKQFYYHCHSDIQSTKLQIEDYLKHNHDKSIVPTLRQLSFNVLHEWNEQLRHSNSSFDTISIGDLLQDINDEDAYEELIIDSQINDNSVQITDLHQVKIPGSMINHLQELYGKLPIESSDTVDGLSLQLDDDLSMNLYQALQRHLGISNKMNKPVNKKKLPKENKEWNKQQRWNLPSENESNMSSNTKNNSPSLKKIMDEEMNYITKQKQAQRRPVDFASHHKLKQLEQQFPSFSPDVIYDIFYENECDYSLTYTCMSSMLDENATITLPIQSQSFPTTSTLASTTSQRSPIVPAESVSASYEISRRDARACATKRKECFGKADQANRHGMIGVASYYINQAREQARLMKDANRMAYQHLSKIKLQQFRQTHRLDLHELYSDEALQLFKQVEQELSEGNRRTTPKLIEVITGYGKSSVYGGGCGKIRSVIISYLRQKNYKYSEPNKGAITVQF